MSEYTKLPWSIGGDGADIFGYGIEPNGSDCRHIADVQPADSGLLGMEVVDVANAAFIVRACNNFYQLEDALNRLLDRYTELVNCGDCGNWDCETEGEVIAARQAIKNAEEAWTQILKLIST